MNIQVVNQQMDTSLSGKSFEKPCQNQKIQTVKHPFKHDFSQSDLNYHQILQGGQNSGWKSDQPNKLQVARRGRPPQRRGRPEPNLGIRHQAKHFTTIWSAELLYKYQSSGKTNSYLPASYKQYPLSAFIPKDQLNQMVYQDIISHVSTSKRCERLMETLTKLSFARDQQVTKEFFEIYFKVLNAYVSKERNRPAQTRDSWVREQVEELRRGEYKWIRVKNSVDKEKEEKGFRRLLYAICHSIVATYENDTQVKDIYEFYNII